MGISKQFTTVALLPSTKKKLKKRGKANDCSSVDELINQLLDSNKGPRDFIEDDCNDIAKQMKLDDPAQDYKDIGCILQGSIIKCLKKHDHHKFHKILLDYIEGK